ncbi:ferredoxin--nitrite reductase [Poseidonibacter lekithochrous]|uniref:ferredoxin--nitrite reductase n=1 Tax=Poseidonibacter TaxID=2321187 RepID=UPI001C08874D|nr:MULTISPECIES: ferredoxin--nitrite reductase [Poseidonibacter]MBU3015938.1 ferredoxin--nitrite reductase [Poseidonibacter lekithochrous]MDO6829237.1 ferredoxin--nitrite reductase [Poseidonibacter sp. 1_MG-2023]
MKVLEEAHNLRNKKINKIEKMKSEQNPIDFIKSFEEFCKGAYEETVTDSHTKHFLKCLGLYDKGTSDTFVIRIRIPGGQLSVKQALKLAECSKKYGNDYIDITTRGQVEFRYLKFNELPDLLKDLNSVGISATQCAGDNFRGVVTSPLDGYSKTSPIETIPLLKEIQSVFLKQEAWMGTLPRKFNIAILGDSVNTCNIFGNDCAFALAKKNGELGFNLYLGGKVGVQARDLNLFVKDHQVKEVFASVISLYKTYGFRDNRNKNRLTFLLDAVSLEEFAKSIKEYSKLELLEAGELLVKDEFTLEDSSTIELKDKKSAIHFGIPSGIFSGSDLKEAALLAQKYDGVIRLTYEQSFYIITDTENIEDIKNSALYKKYDSYHNIYFNNQIACPGNKECSFGVIPSKPTAIEMAHYLNENIPIKDGKVRMYWSACPKGCGIHGVADIGFEGAKAKDEEGKSCFGVKIFIGGKAASSILEARQLTKAVTIPKAQVVVKELLTIYKEEKKENETFESFDTRVLSHLEIEEIQTRIGL